MLPLWNWQFGISHMYLLPYPFILFATVTKGFFSHNEEKIIAFCLIIFAIILYHSIKASLIEFFEERSAAIAAEYREVIQVRRGILPKMRRFLRLFLDLEDAVARTGVCLFYDVINLQKKKNENRKLFITHFFKNKVNKLFSHEKKSENILVENEKTKVKSSSANNYSISTKIININLYYLLLNNIN